MSKNRTETTETAVTVLRDWTRPRRIQTIPSLDLWKFDLTLTAAAMFGSANRTVVPVATKKVFTTLDLDRFQFRYRPPTGARPIIIASPYTK